MSSRQFQHESRYAHADRPPWKILDPRRDRGAPILSDEEVGRCRKEHLNVQIRKQRKDDMKISWDVIVVGIIRSAEHVE